MCQCIQNIYSTILSDCIDGTSSATMINGCIVEKADDVFISWLKSCRESGVTVTLPKVKEKVAQLFATYGATTIEKSCKWFLLWNNR